MHGFQKFEKPELEMLKYCIETIHKPPVHFQIVHQHHCSRFPNMDVFSLSRFKDIGAFSTHQGALARAKELLLDTYPCSFCCGEAPLQQPRLSEEPRRKADLQAIRD